MVFFSIITEKKDWKLFILCHHCQIRYNIRIRGLYFTLFYSLCTSVASIYYYVQIMCKNIYSLHVGNKNGIACSSTWQRDFKGRWQCFLYELNYQLPNTQSVVIYSGIWHSRLHVQNTVVWLVSCMYCFFECPFVRQCNLIKQMIPAWFCFVYDQCINNDLGGRTVCAASAVLIWEINYSMLCSLGFLVSVPRIKTLCFGTHSTRYFLVWV